VLWPKNLPPRCKSWTVMLPRPLAKKCTLPKDHALPHWFTIPVKR
jgi:hypothetical protein